MKQHKAKAHKSPITERRLPPTVGRSESGRPVLFCPFCNPPHEIVPGKQYACGTRLDVTAVQVVVRAQFDKHIRCIKCGKGGGKMVPAGAAYMHAHDCAPDVLVLQNAPTSGLAKFVYTHQNPVVRWLFRKRGTPQIIHKVMPDGTRTGEIIGYTFVQAVR